MNEVNEEINEFISKKVESFKWKSNKFKIVDDYYCFVALAIKSIYFKNPSYDLNEDDLIDMLATDENNTGIDAIFLNPDGGVEENHDLILSQGKYYASSVTLEDIRNALTKMFLFFDNLKKGNDSSYPYSLVSLFQKNYSEMSDDSKVCFDLYVNAPRNGIKDQSIKKILEDYFGSDIDKYSVNVYFDKDIKNEIEELEARRPFVESGTLRIDEPDNVLFFNDENAAVVNISALSLKELYSQYKNNCLANNLRYYIKKKDIDTDIKETINKDKDSFWYKNNGITISCEDFEIDSKILKLKDFSIINGGQTTYLIYNSNINESNDFYLCAKIIKTQGNTEEEKQDFLLKVAIATNSQKAIKKSDLKANTSEQIRFARNLRNLDIQYIIKRGEAIDSKHKDKDKNTNLEKVGKLCLACIFQLPGKSRTSPSIMWKDQYYNKIFDKNTSENIANLVKDYLYINTYYETKFLKKYTRDHKGDPHLPIANNARTFSIAFISLAARYIHGNIKDEDTYNLSRYIDKDNEKIYDIFSNIKNESYVFSKHAKENYDHIDEVLTFLFTNLINSIYDRYSTAKEYDTKGTLNETNFLKNDSNYYRILTTKWDLIKQYINVKKDIFEEL